MGDPSQPPEGFVLRDVVKQNEPPEGFALRGLPGKDLTEETPWEPEVDPQDVYGQGIKDRAKMTLGAGELAATSLVAGVAEVASGNAGLVALALSGDPDYAAKRVKAWQDFITFEPQSDGAQYLLRQVMPSLSRADVAINDFAEERATDEDGNINVALATTIKTGLWSSIDIAAFAVPGGKALLQKSALRKMRKNIIAEADRLGIKLDLEDFADDVSTAARELGSDHSGQMAIEYTEALRAAEKTAKRHKNSLYAAAAGESLYVQTTRVRQLGTQLIRRLDESYDLDADGIGMSHVRAVLNDLTGQGQRRGMGRGTGLEVGQSLAVHFSQIERIRKRINRRITATSKDPKLSSGNSALMEIKKSLDGWLTDEFNKTAINNGKIVSNGSALSGDAAGLDAYLAARKGAQQHAWFKEIKVMSDLLSKDATSTEVAQWVIGSSPIAKTGTARTVDRMKLLLGADHPAIDALRQDFIFQLTKPLFTEMANGRPNFKGFLRNYERVLLENRPLADAFGLDQHDIKILADFARVADKLPTPRSKAPRLYTLKEIISTAARLGVGSDVAKGAARVGFATKVGNLIFGADDVAPRQIKGAVVDARFDQPWIPRSSPVYLAIMAGASLSPNEDEE